MPFRRPRRADARLQGWRAFAARLELEDAAEQAERVRQWLALGSEALRPLYALRRAGQPSLYLFEQRGARRGPTGSVPRWLSGVLLRSSDGLSATPLRAMARRNEVMESLESSRTGSHRLVFDDAREADDAISIFARDAVAARTALPPATRDVLRRALLGRDARPVVVVGQQHLMVTAEGLEPASFDSLEGLASDLLMLYALLAAPAPPS